MEYIMVNIDVLLLTIALSMVQIAYWKGETRDLLYAMGVLIIIIVIMCHLSIKRRIDNATQYHSPSMACKYGGGMA